MTGYTADTREGRIVAAETDTIFRPRTPRNGTCGVILLHGQGNPEAFMDAENQKASVRLAAALASAGIPTIAGTMHGNAWANDAGMTAITNAWTTLKTAYPAMRTDKLCLLGGSMGGAMAVRYTQLHPGSVAAMVGLIPAYDPLAIYNYGNVGDAAMETAWTFSGVGNFPDALNLGPKGALANTVPILTGYASDDTVVPASSVTNYHTLAGGTPDNIINVGALGHTDAAIAAVPLTTIIRFLVTAGA